MKYFAQSVRRRRVSIALGTTALATGLLLPASAHAQCAPDPTQTNGTTNCVGTDNDGLTVNTPGSQVTVAAGATVQSGGSSAAIAVTSVSDYITVNGTVDGAGKPGISVIAGPPVNVPCDPYAGASISYCVPGSTVTSNPSASAAITIARDATVTGAQALLVSRDPGNSTGYVNVSLYNAGTISGTAGPALVATLAPGGFSSAITATNTTTGFIGGMTGSIGYVGNDGTIDGNGNAAIDTNTSYANISNTGQILSSGSATTVSASGTLTLSNAAGATLGGGANAISAGGALTLTNTGTINGSVTSTASAGQASTIDTRGGTIAGNVTLGAGDDMLRVDVDTATDRISSITGAIDGGAGTDTLAIAISRDTTLGAFALPTNFELLGVDLDNNATVTLTPAFATTGGIAFGGYGTVVNQANLTTTGPAAIATNYSSQLAFTNQGNITATLSNSSQFAVGTPTSLTNTGTITAIGGNGAQAYATLNNSGTILASGTGASLFYGALDNSGTITSTGGIGATISGSSYNGASTNRGSITGATTGLTLSGTLTNTGTITGGTTGVALGYSGVLINAAGGTVGGGTTAIGNAGLSVRVVNGGTINGNVDLASSLGFDSSADVFVDTGGTVNGAITLGAGDDQLVVDIASAANRPLAGATGGVDAGTGYDTLRYRVNADATAALALPSGFEGLAYELDNKAALTLTAQSPLTTTIGLAGNGTVTLNGTISASDRTLIDAGILTTDQLVFGTAGPTRALSIINNGALSLTTTQPYSYTSLSAISAGSADVTNAGTITVNNAAGTYYPATAISGGGTITNTGTITLTGGGTAIGYATTVINAGTITDTPGSNATGVSSFTALQNSGVIQVDGLAVQTGFYGGSIVNSGTIESRLSTAVTLGYSATLTNAAGGTIRGVTAVDLSQGGGIINRGAIVGDVAARSYYSTSAGYFADGGTVVGNVRFGAGNDLFVESGTTTGVTGIVDGGAGEDVFGHVLTSSGSVSLDGDPTKVVNFEDALVQAVGPGTVATVTASNPFAGQLFVSGDGTVVNQATIAGIVTTSVPYSAQVLSQSPYTLAAFENQGTLGSGVSGTIGRFTNSGTITSNSYFGVNLEGTDGVTIVNSGRIDTSIYLNSAGANAITNSATISASGSYGRTALEVYLGGGYNPFTGQNDTAIGTVSIVNGGTIEAILSDDASATYSQGIVLSADRTTSATLSNTATGTIRAAGADGIGLYAYNAALTLDNAGTISGGGVAADGSFRGGAIYASGSGANTIRNTGTLAGAVVLDAGDDMIENSGTITGPVLLGAGNDIFIQHATATIGGIVDGGTGANLFVMDSTGNGSLRASQLANFQQLRQTGTGSVGYSGTFGVETIGLDNGTLTVATGDTLATAGATTVTGGDAGVAIVNAGTIAGGIALGTGADRVVNLGAIAGRVTLGAGNDSYVEGAGSSVAGGVDGGSGTDLYEVALAGDRTGIGTRSNFEQLAVTGSGTLALTLDQNFQSVALGGANLTLALAGHVIGSVSGSDAAEAVSVDGDLASVTLGGGDDSLTIGSAHAAGRYDGGDGTDLLRFAATAPVTLTGTATGFERIALSGPSLTVTGTLGSPGTALVFGDSAQQLTIADGGTLAGTVDLGGGDDSFTLAAGGTLDGSVSGGAGTDTATVEVAGGRTVASGTLLNFERFVTTGSGTTTLTGAQSYATVTAGTDITVAAGGSLTTGQITFGAHNDRFTIAGQFAGSVDGGAGTNTLSVSGGSAAAPVAFDTVANVETYAQSAGYATVSGTATFSTVDLAGGRLVGLAGSTIAAPQIVIRNGATFGSAGTVTGNLAVQGTLSPGASPGTMTVNGNVSLAGSSVSVFELTPTVSNRLVVNGTFAIASGATLQLAPTGTLKPGASYQLITASGGIAGSYTTIVKPGTVFGVLVQRANSLDLLGQFVDPGTFSLQVSRSIAYANAALILQPATSSLFAALPALLTGSGGSNAQAFARLTPEPYASATQGAVDDALTITEALRGPAFAASGTQAHVYTLGQILGGWRRLAGDFNIGTAATQTHGYGLLGGIGFGDARASVGAFGGYLNDRQGLDELGARTKTDAWLAGLAARFRSAGGLGGSASISYEDGTARTDRALPGSTTATGRYHLRSWIGDGAISYDIGVASGWTLQPKVGATYVHTTRGGLAETGNSAFTLTVARYTHDAVFVDAGLRFGRSDASDAAFRPFVAFGVRYQAEGRGTSAVAGYADGGLGLYALGAQRADVVGTVAGGVGYRLAGGIDLFATGSSQVGDGDDQEAVSGGVRLRF